MRLFALRGATSVESNEADAILAATERADARADGAQRARARGDGELHLHASTEDLDAEFPALAARQLGLTSVPLLCARELPVPGSLPRVIRVLVHYYAPRTTFRGMCTSERRARCEPTSTRHNRPAWRSSSRSASAGSRSYPVAGGYDLGEDVAMLASNESCFAPLPEVVEAAQRVIAGANRYPDPSYSALRSALAGPLRRPRRADRAGQRLVRHPAGRGRGAARARAPRSSTRGRRSASTRTSPPPPARARSRCRSTPTIAMTSTRWPTRSRSRPGWC